MFNMHRQTLKAAGSRFRVALLTAGASMLWASVLPVMAAAPVLPISQVPLTVTLPAHPQILLAVGNSQSMDGDLSGAIWTGSGSLAAYPLLGTSSSPSTYVIPPGFTPPVNPGSGGSAPYTVSVNGVLQDNSASRLNVAKAGITAILNAYMASADFALMDYNTGGLGAYSTWVYQMSAAGGFTFSATVPTSGRYVANPCFGIDITGSNLVQTDCKALNTFYSGQSMLTKRYMIIAASSDDAAISDVLYDNGTDPVCVVYGGPSPTSPYSLGLSAYNSASVRETYTTTTAGCGRVTQTGPTNAGFVPASPQVMYEQRGFGFLTQSESGSTATTVVTMASSGPTPTALTVSTAIGRFANFLLPETASASTTELKASATQSPMAGIISAAVTLFAGNPLTTNGCTAQRYVVLMTDGLPTMDLQGLSWPPLGSSAAIGYGVTANFAADGSYVAAGSNDQALTDVIAKLQLLNSGANPVKTYIIGLGGGINPSPTSQAAKTLTAMAIAGGTGTYFPATTPQAVTDDLQSIITTILAQSQSTASAAVNSTGLNVNSIVYQSQFVTSDTYQDWTGDVFAFPINATSGVVDTAPADTKWSAQAKLDVLASRVIATWDPVAARGAPFEWTSSGAIGAGTVIGQSLTTFTPDINGQDVLQYLRGSTAQEVRSGGKFRNRAHLLGDIVDSNPAYIGQSSEGIQSNTYISFAAGTANRAPVLYIGADDGMMHAFDASTPCTGTACPPVPAGNPGKELFAYIPRGAYSNLIGLVSPYYNAQHHFYVNGSPQAGDVQFSDLSWHSVLVGTEAAGGNSVYALDVTAPSTLISESALASAVLWDFIDTNMGLGFSTPVIANTNSGWQVIFGNGYNSTNQKPYLYALNPQTGVVSAKIDLCAAVTTACNLNLSNGLSSVAVVNSSGQVAGVANLVYAGDLQGNLWRVDISNSNPSSWAATVLFQARDAATGGNLQPITTKPVVSLNPLYPQVLGTMVVFGTGQFLGTPDSANQRTQSIYGVYDPPAGYSSAINRSSLLPQALTATTIGAVQVRTVSGTKPVVPANKGWYIDLTLLAGERVINDPRLESGGELVLTTYQPILPVAGSCNARGSSYLMVLNFATGGAFTTPQFDVTGDGRINSSDAISQTVGGITSTINPVGMSLGSVYASAPTIRSGAFGTGTGIALITESTPGVAQGGIDAAPIILPVILKGSAKTRTAWWEIRQ
jgi:type IV pilus assembly protein PilY1